jgi:central kinetochore subunit Mis15/CHL4
LERFVAVIEDLLDLDDAHRPQQGDGAEFRPSVKVLFHGKHVFAGVRKLVENGIIDGAKMPAWMTGEADVTGGKVQNGRMHGWDGV